MSEVKNTMGLTKKPRTLIRDGLAVLLLLPAIGIAMYHSKRAIFARFDEPVLWESASQTWLRISGELLVPLAVGLFVAWFVVRRDNLRLGIELGIFATFVVYVVMFLTLPQCNTQVGINCNEGAVFMLFRWAGMFIVNTMALVGSGYWLDKLNQRRISAAT